MNHIPNILKQNPTFNALKLLATIADRNAVINWAIFYSFKSGIGSLWLIPVTEHANNEAETAATNLNLPDITLDELVIRNTKTNTFWYDDEPSWDTDTVLTLENNTKLLHLEKLKGKWASAYLEEIGTQWNYWRTIVKINTNNAAIVFPAPKSHIINSDGKYVDYEVWFGIRDNIRPFIGIDVKNTYNGNDVPIIWNNDKRNDDLVVYGDMEEFGAGQFKDLPLQQYKDQEYFNGTRSIQFLAIFGDTPTGVKAWMYIEKNKRRDDRNCIAICYASQIKFDRVDFTYVIILQICRADQSHLLTKLYSFSALLKESYRLLKQTKNGIKSTLASNPIGIVPQSDSEPNFNIPNTITYASEWVTENSSNCTFSPTFKLIRSLVFLGNEAFNPDTVAKASFNINLNNTVVKSDVGLADSGIVLFDASFQTDIDLEQTNDNGTVLRFLLADYNIAKSQKIIDGAFEFDLGFGTDKVKDLPKKFGEIRFTLQNKHTQTPFFIWQYHKKIAYEDIVLQYSIEDFSLPVKAVKAAGQDLMGKERYLAASSIGAIVEGAGERDESPLIIPRKNENKENSYFLTFSESINLGQDYRLDIKLQEIHPEANINNSSSIKAIVLDTNPQFIGLLDARFLQQPGYDDGAWVLARRSQLSLESGAWEILDDSANTGFRLILPSQAIGEAYTKKDFNDPDADGEPKEGHPINFKFGAPAILKLANERLERRYVAPPWNLRHIWGQPGTELPGVPFLETQFELLYGLKGHLKPEKTNIAELASKLGEIPVPPNNTIFWEPTAAQNSTFTASWKNYLQFYRAWKSRLAILEPSREDAFTNTRFVDNLKFAPRIDFRAKLLRPLEKVELEYIINAVQQIPLESDGKVKIIDAAKGVLQSITDHHSPEIISRKQGFLKDALDNAKEIANTLNLFERFGASLKYPIGTVAIPQNGEISANDLSDPNSLDKKIYASHDEEGLAGGFHYGFESKEIYKEFWREAYKQGSSSAQLEDLAYSSVGGWGKASAKFAGDKTVIKSTTAMGRTNFYAVERIGRIGVLWHKAKHVIEYERCTVPSAYFPSQPALLGRPIVRKVREYIEILEPTKNYPDYEGHNDDAPGSIKACHFKSIIIPVRSSWGKDVAFNMLKVDKEDKPILDAGKKVYEYKNFGWEIKLWDRAADPKLFPKPQIAFELLAPAGSNIESVMVNLSEPENLRFYTDTRPNVDIGEDKPVVLTADTTKWPAIKYVDYTDLELPNERHLDPANPKAGTHLEQAMPDVLDVAPGFERYTFKVDLSELPAGVANRYNAKSGISGKLKAVTMMRKPVLKDKDGHEIKPEIHPAFKLLVTDSTSVINKLYNGQLSQIKSIKDVATSLYEAFGRTAGGTKLSAFMHDFNKGLDKPNLRYFKDLYKVTTKDDLPVFRYLLQQYPTKYLWRDSVISGEGLLNKTIALYTEQANIFKGEIDALIKKGGDYQKNATDILERFKDNIGAFHLNVDYGIEFLTSSQLQLEAGINLFKNRLNDGERQAADEIEGRLRVLEALIADTTLTFDQLKAKSIAALKKIAEACANAAKTLDSVKLPSPELKQLKDEIIKIIKDVEDLVTQTANEVGTFPDTASLNIALSKLKNHIRSEIETWFNKIGLLIKEIETFEKKGFEELNLKLKNFKHDVEDAEKKVIDKINEAIDEVKIKWNENATNIQASYLGLVDDLKNTFLIADTGSFKAVLQHVLYAEQMDESGQLQLSNDCIFGVLFTIDSWLNGVIGIIKDAFIPNFIDQFSNFTSVENIEKWLKTLDAYKNLESAINNGGDILGRSVALANRLNRDLGKLAEEVSEKVKAIDQAVASFDAMRNSGSQVLDNYRSVWNEFTAPGMGLNRRTISMIVNMNPRDIQERLSITPCISRVKQFENDLEGLGLRLPVTNIFEGLLPPKPEWAKDVEDYGKSLLNKFNFSDVLSDIGAMRLDKLFPSFKMPNNFRDNIKVTQGFDKQNLFAWVNAEINFKLDAPQQILAIGPIIVNLNKGHFIAKVRMEMDIEGNTKKENNGTLAGDWETNIGGIPIMVFKEAKAIFEGDKLTFDLDPSRMEMPGLLKLLTDATKNIPSGGDGAGNEAEDVFKISLLEIDGEELNPAFKGRKLPIGVKASLNIPPISIGGGTTSMTNLSFGGHFVLQFWDTENRKFDFMTGLGFYLGKEEAPFNFTAFILGGGGFVNSNIIFKPQEGLTVIFIMSVHASVGFAITLGWMNGSVLISLGLEGEYRKIPTAPSRVYVTIFVQIVGVVDILGLVTVYLRLRLAATYTGDQLIGKGMVELKIKICWCVTVSVHKLYQKTFINNSSSEKVLTADKAKTEALKISNTLS
jgi:hypothetical protein